VAEFKLPDKFKGYEMFRVEFNLGVIYKELQR
jgi:hypothetical protein